MNVVKWGETVHVILSPVQLLVMMNTSILLLQHIEGHIRSVDIYGKLLNGVKIAILPYKNFML